MELIPLFWLDAVLRGFVDLREYGDLSLKRWLGFGELGMSFV